MCGDKPDNSNICFIIIFYDEFNYMKFIVTQIIKHYHLYFVPLKK